MRQRRVSQRPWRLVSFRFLIVIQKKYGGFPFLSFLLSCPGVWLEIGPDTARRLRQSLTVVSAWSGGHEAEWQDRPRLLI